MGSDKKALLHRHIALGSAGGECERLYRFLADSLADLPVSLEFRHDIKLVAEELLANIIKHGYAADGAGEIGLELCIDDNSVHLTFTDAGRAFNPLEHEPAAALNDLSQGGMGILLVKSLTDEQRYSRDGHHNVLTVSKNYNKKKS